MGQLCLEVLTQLCFTDTEQHSAQLTLATLQCSGKLTESRARSYQFPIKNTSHFEDNIETPSEEKEARNQKQSRVFVLWIYRQRHRTPARHIPRRQRHTEPCGRVHYCRPRTAVHQPHRAADKVRSRHRHHPTRRPLTHRRRRHTRQRRRRRRRHHAERLRTRGAPAQAPHRRRHHRHAIARVRRPHLQRTEHHTQVRRRVIRRRPRRPIDLHDRCRREPAAPHMHRHRPRPRHHTRRRHTRQHWDRRNVRHRQRRALRNHHPVLTHRYTYVPTGTGPIPARGNVTVPLVTVFTWALNVCVP